MIEQPWLQKAWWTRVAIVGTAQSWKQTPWDDPGVRILGLNDLYVLGVPRADAWFELHPLHHMHFRKKDQRVVNAADVPPGYYVRPEGHHAWLQEFAKTKPVFLQQVPDGWPAYCQRFPIEPVLSFLHGYSASGPALMIAYAILNGVQELAIYGIHLATDAEYREQRPNFEALLGRFLGVDQLIFTIEGEMRRYVGTNNRTLLLPKASPIFQHDRIYGYQPKPQPPAELTTLRERLAGVRAAYSQRCAALIERPWWKLGDRSLIAEKDRLEIKLADLSEQVARFQRRSSGAVIQTEAA